MQTAGAKLRPLFIVLRPQRRVMKSNTVYFIVNRIGTFTATIWPANVSGGAGNG